MTDRSRTDSALSRPNWRFMPRRLAKFLAFCLSFSSLALALSEKASARALGRIAQQPAQAPREAGAKADDENGARLLEHGKTIKRELAGGHSHTYRITLSAGQFLKVIVEQQGIDIVIQLSGPGGEQIAEFDSESRSQGQELAPFVAEANGVYLLTVRPKFKNAQTGGYEIRIEELRAATDDDRALHEARKLFQRASKLRDAGKYDEAFPKFEGMLSKYPDTPYLHFAYGDALAYISRYDEGIVQLKENTRRPNRSINGRWPLESERWDQNTSMSLNL